ncbi:uncharacterized protein QC761_109583 [Podospora bellae-mahoneyi]|uniref:Uncharacterized protein n=1 Tax=Podospora bellae-mahoneyi TaxID=2093777 RepID=A0ABR0FWQ0_9PEZI|nr:hypothetical protein QC761_109583 [Podospora bellae-mahoneyi]
MSALRFSCTICSISVLADEGKVGLLVEGHRLRLVELGGVSESCRAPPWLDLSSGHIKGGGRLQPSPSSPSSASTPPTCCPLPTSVGEGNNAVTVEDAGLAKGRAASQIKQAKMARCGAEIPE